MCSPHYWHGACVWSSSIHMLWEAVMEGCSPGLQDSIDHFLWSSARGIFDSIVFISFSSVFLLKRKRKRFKDQWKRRFYALSKQMFSNNVIFEPFIQKWTSFKCWNQNSKSWKRFYTYEFIVWILEQINSTIFVFLLHLASNTIPKMAFWCHFVQNEHL